MVIWFVTQYLDCKKTPKNMFSYLLQDGCSIFLYGTRAIARNVVAGALSSAHNKMTMGSVMVLMDAEFLTPPDVANQARRAAQTFMEHAVHQVPAAEDLVDKTQEKPKVVDGDDNSNAPSNALEGPCRRTRLSVRNCITNGHCAGALCCRAAEERLD